jgi:hypothetical protein
MVAAKLTFGSTKKKLAGWLNALTAPFHPYSRWHTELIRSVGK